MILLRCSVPSNSKTHQSSNIRKDLLGRVGVPARRCVRSRGRVAKRWRSEGRKECITATSARQRNPTPVGGREGEGACRRRVHIELCEKGRLFEFGLRARDGDEEVEQVVLFCAWRALQVDYLQYKREVGWAHELRLFLLYPRFDTHTHLLEIGERGVTDQKGIVKDKALRWVLLSRREIRIRHIHPCAFET